jgi:hypothetical protein
VSAGEQIAVINPDEGTNGNVAAHLHMAYMARGYDPGTKQDPLPILDGANNPAVSEAPTPASPDRAATCLTGRPHHHRDAEEIDGQILDARAEGLINQALLYALCEHAGLDAAAIYQSAKDSF